MALAILRSGAPVEIPAGDSVTTDQGVQASYATLQIWSEPERNAFGVYTIAEPGDPPAGKIVVGTSLSISQGQVSRTATLADAPPAPVPQVVSDLQARLALQAAGLFGAVESAIASADTPTKIWYDRAITWHRDNAILMALGASLGLTSAQIDNLFRAAAAIES